MNTQGVIGLIESFLHGEINKVSGDPTEYNQGRQHAWQDTVRYLQGVKRLHEQQQ